jgi:lysozyme
MCVCNAAQQLMLLKNDVEKKMLTTAQQEILKKELIDDEGYEKFIYKDTRGLETVGIGYLCKNGFSDAVIDLMFKECWERTYNFLVKSFPWFENLNFPRKYAIISMVFNLGERGFTKFSKVITALSHEEFDKASLEMNNSLWSKQVPRRVNKLSKIIKTGSF